MAQAIAPQRLRTPLLAPGLMALAMLALLIGLGVWQLQRRTWKLGLLAQIDAAEAAPAIPLPADPPPFAKVRVEGRLRPDLQAFYGADVRDLPAGPALGAQLIEPLERAGQPPVLVDLGWVPTGMAVAPGGSAVEGYIRQPDHPGLFSARDDAAQRRFYTLDPGADRGGAGAEGGGAVHAGGARRNAAGCVPAARPTRCRDRRTTI